MGTGRKSEVHSELHTLCMKFAYQPNWLRDIEEFGNYAADDGNAAALSCLVD